MKSDVTQHHVWLKASRFDFARRFVRARRYVHVGVVAALCLSISSCSLLASGKQPVTVSSNDPQATLRADGQYIGIGSGTISLTKNRAHVITAQNGNKVGSVIIDNGLSPTGVLDIVGTCIFIVPFIGLFSKGAWMLDEDNVVVEVH